MVLNDKNLLDYLVRVIKESPPLPDAVRATVRAPSTVFLFVGFGFHNWWLRLLLKVLEMTGGGESRLSPSRSRTIRSTRPSRRSTRPFSSRSASSSRRETTGTRSPKHLAASYPAKPPVPPAASARPGAAAPAPQAGGGGPIVFLSYASEDSPRVDALRMALERRGRLRLGGQAEPARRPELGAPDRADHRERRLLRVRADGEHGPARSVGQGRRLQLGAEGGAGAAAQAARSARCSCCT